ncbi:amino acid/amide ABC transporter substrate-binding protein (HAAT family) [Nocardia tenerifensis]|uniref:Amino acid/amide ABC transporter substrate-binding protein (HAAT family) n=1 Tax=Nocardia tenerifensis TaxID=228006 RepID=A0A318KBQ9_9NOCA|nr:amino acid/amide ABC transporter substrate-binding protein (HAAT family) [Nocardia tenerifensis]
MVHLSTISNPVSLECTWKCAVVIPLSCYGFRRATVDIALVVPLSGSAGMFGPSCEACAALAVADINAAGGILDRQVRLHPVDAGAPLPVLAATIDRMVGTGMVDGVVGWHLSNARKVITPHTAGRVPYVYTTFYEGGEDSDGVYMVGETPEQQLFPALRWLRAEHGIRRWCVVGNDYVWPRETARAAVEFMAGTDLEIVGQSFVPLGGRDFRQSLDLIHRSPAQGVLLFMVGADCAAFNNAFAEAGLDGDRLRLSMMIGEDVLYAGGADSTRGLFTASGYFESVVSAAGMDFGARYLREFGPAAPALNNIGESCYEGLLLFASLVESARSLDLRAIERSAPRVSYGGPRGEVRVRGAHTTQPVYLADADALEFSVLAELDS